MTFVDSSALAALLIPTESNHQKAIQWVQDNSNEELITSDYIIDELYTLVLARTKCKKWTIDIITAFRKSDWLAPIVYVSQTDFLDAEQVFLAYEDKGWSFTDCTCKIIMERYGVTQAFAFDKHFSQFGQITVVPF